MRNQYWREQTNLAKTSLRKGKAWIRCQVVGTISSKMKPRLMLGEVWLICNKMASITLVKFNFKATEISSRVITKSVSTKYLLWEVIHLLDKAKEGWRRSAKRQSWDTWTSDHSTIHKSLTIWMKLAEQEEILIRS